MTRAKGSLTTKIYKWSILMFDETSGEFKQGKFCSINHLNRELGLNISNDLAWRMISKNRVDFNNKFGEKSFLNKYKHIKLEKINEPVPQEV